MHFYIGYASLPGVLVTAVREREACLRNSK